MASIVAKEKVTSMDLLAAVEVVDDVNYQRIWVNSTRGLQVTFNDSTNQEWHYHGYSTYPHITELFHVETFPNNEVQIYGYLPPKTRGGEQVTWYLSVQEYSGGAAERYPTFRPFLEEGTSTDSLLHTTFTVAQQDKLIALKFVTNYNSESVYLVPQSNKMRTKKTNVPQYFFRFDLGGNIVLLEDINPAEVIS